MKPHPDFADLDMPQTHQLGAFHLAILTAADLDEDFEAVMSSKAVLRGIFGPTWPEGLTRAEDETDLHWHHREFTARRSFAWVIRNAEGRYIGCAYLNPDISTCGVGDATYWMIDAPERLAWLAAFGPLYVEWLGSVLPSGYDMQVRSNV